MQPEPVAPGRPCLALPLDEALPAALLSLVTRALPLLDRLRLAACSRSLAAAVYGDVDDWRRCGRPAHQVLEVTFSVDSS